MEENAKIFLKIQYYFGEREKGENLRMLNLQFLFNAKVKNETIEIVGKGGVNKRKVQIRNQGYFVSFRHC